MSMTSELTVQDNPVDWELMHQVVIRNDLSGMSEKDQVQYIRALCESLHLNPLSQPFKLLRMRGRQGGQGALVVYATKDCTDQLRRLNGISIDKVESEQLGEIFIVTVYGHDKTGRTDSEMGAVSMAGQRGEDLANCYMKAHTKAKRRLTLSLTGLGMLDDSEVDSVPGAQRVEMTVNEPERIMVSTVTGEVVDLATRAQLQKFWILARELYTDAAEQSVREWLATAHPQTVAVNPETGRKEYSTKLLTVEQISERIEFMQRNITARDAGVGETTIDAQDSLFPEGGPNLPEPLPRDEMEMREQHDQPKTRPTRPQRKVTSADFAGGEPIPFK